MTADGMIVNGKFILAIDVKRIAVDKVQLVMGDTLIDYFSMNDYHKFVEQLLENERFQLDIVERNFLDFHAPAVRD